MIRFQLVRSAGLKTAEDGGVAGVITGVGRTCGGGDRGARLQFDFPALPVDGAPENVADRSDSIRKESN